MPRSGKQARRRLQEAALELYRDRGYDRTTTAEIAARAGVTERTFFRHFPDKREVLFGNEAEIRVLLTDAVRTAPAGLSPLDVLLHAFRAAGRIIAEQRSFSVPRAEVIAATPALRERELAKFALLTEALATALRERGVADRSAGLAARTGWAAFEQATAEWMRDPSVDVDEHLDRAFADLRALATPV